jgi:hypothetical protein
MVDSWHKWAVAEMATGSAVGLEVSRLDQWGVLKSGRARTLAAIERIPEPMRFRLLMAVSAVDVNRRPETEATAYEWSMDGERDGWRPLYNGHGKLTGHARRVVSS